MTTLADPYPTDLAQLDELPAGSGQVTEADRLIRAVNRLAQALEQHTLALLHPAGESTTTGPTWSPEIGRAAAPLAALPPVQGAQPISSVLDVCPIHATPWKTVPAGISKRTGAAYAAFRACSTAGCDQRPKL